MTALSMGRDAVFVDTGAWFAHSVAADPDHAAAVAFAARCNQTFVTSDYVVDELLTLFARRARRALGAQWLREVLFAGACELIRVDEVTFREACDIYASFADKDWSFTDCTSYVLMRRLGIERAFLFDQHFRQFGTVKVYP